MRLPVAATAASVACAFAAVGVALYGQVDPWRAGALYGGFGLAAGLVCAVLDMAWRQLPTLGRGEQAAAMDAAAQDRS
jgi:VIT1/CCC1 family predicted Fe2+/Mn2+ transporter